MFIAFSTGAHPVKKVFAQKLLSVFESNTF